MDFSETIAASNLKVSRSRHLIEYMKICQYWRSRLFLDLGSRLCTYKNLNWIFSETTVPIWTKLCMKAFRYKEMKIWWHDTGHMTKMAATPLNGKNQSKIFVTWYVAFGTPAHLSLFKLWPWSDLDLFYGKVFVNVGFSIGKQWIFQKLLQPVTWKVVGADI